MTTRRGEAVVLAGLLATAGVTHLLRPGLYDPIEAVSSGAGWWRSASPAGRRP